MAFTDWKFYNKWKKIIKQEKKIIKTGKKIIKAGKRIIKTGKGNKNKRIRRKSLRSENISRLFEKIINYKYAFQVFLFQVIGFNQIK